MSNLVLRILRKNPPGAIEPNTPLIAGVYSEYNIYLSWIFVKLKHCIHIQQHTRNKHLIYFPLRQRGIVYKLVLTLFL